MLRWKRKVRRGVGCLVLIVAVMMGACMPPTPEGDGGVVVTPQGASTAVASSTLPPRATLPSGATPAPEDTPSPAPTAPAAPPDEPATRTHAVQPGETLLGLALHYDVPMAAIQLQNDLGAATDVQAGQVLEIPPGAGWEGASPFWIVYRVAEGETLSGIAATYGLDVATLLRVNGLTDADLLPVGTALILPLDAPAEVVAQAHAPTATPRPTATPVPPTATALPITLATATPAASPTVAPSPPKTTTAPPADLAAFPGEIFRLINAERAAHDLPPLQYNAVLAEAAQRHADECYQRGWCGHTGSDGSTMKERIIRAGYDPVRWSECWAWSSSPQKTVAMWMDETPPNDPHRRTLLSTWLTEVGVGVAPGNGHGYYFIADFGTPRE